jgi:hypothetical protein
MEHTQESFRSTALRAASGPAVDGGGYVIIGGRIVHIPPWTPPVRQLLEQLAHSNPMPGRVAMLMETISDASRMESLVTEMPDLGMKSQFLRAVEARVSKSLRALGDAYPNPEDPGDPNNPFGPYGPHGPVIRQVRDLLDLVTALSGDVSRKMVFDHVSQLTKNLARG